MPYFSGKTKRLPADMNRYLIEMDLINTFHWLPQDIAKIPYKWIQKYYFINKIKNEAIATKIETDKILAPYKNSGKRTTSNKGSNRRGRAR